MANFPEPGEPEKEDAMSPEEMQRAIVALHARLTRRK